MSSVARIVLPLAALAVGFALGTVVGASFLSAPSDGDGAPRESSLGAGRAGPGRPEDGEDETSARPGGTRRRGVNVDDIAVESALRSVDSAVAGDGVVRGTVRDLAGHPVAGVLVTATATDNQAEEEPEEDTLEHRLRSVVRAWRYEQATRRTAATGADGAYALTGLVPSAFRLSLQAEGLTFRAADGSDWSASAGDVRDFVALPVVVVTVKATLPDGTEPGEYRVQYRDVLSGSETWMDGVAGGTPLALAPGMWELAAVGGPASAYRAEAVSCEVKEGASQEVPLRLAPRPGVRGTISFGGADRPTSIGVAAYPLSGGASADPALLMAAPYASWTGDPWEYSILDLSAGSYLVGVVLRSGRVLASEVIEIGGDLVVRDFALGDVDVRDYVVVHVRAPDGTAVGDVSIVAGFESNGNVYQSGSDVTQREDGAYVVAHASPMDSGGAPGGWVDVGDGVMVDGPVTFGNPAAPGGGEALRGHFVTVQSAQYGTKRASYDVQRDREITVSFDVPAFAVLSVSGQTDGACAGRLQARLVPADEAANRARFGWNGGEVRVAPSGTTRLGPVSPGRYTVVLVVARSENGSREIASADVHLATGDTSVSLAVPPLQDLVVEVRGAPLDLDLHADPRPGEPCSFLDEGVRQGAFTRFSFATPGRYRVRAFGDGSPGEMIVDLPSAGPVVFQPRPFDCLRVEGVVPPAWRAHVAAGDLIVSVDGQPGENDMALRTAVANARTHPQVTLGVVRGGRAFEATLPSEGIDNVTLMSYSR